MALALEKNDVYNIHRKEAFSMIRSGRQHLVDASNAYFRGDYLSWAEYSRKGKEEICMAQFLNLNAAIDIFKFMNRKNDIRRRVDLHGLHAGEALRALQECLCNLQVKEEENGTKFKTLQVITGVGKHSHGTPVLPIVVRNFLNENGYRFEEIRPGALKVWRDQTYIKCLPFVNPIEVSISSSAY